MNEWTGKAISMPPTQSHAHKNQLQNTIVISDNITLAVI